MTTAPPLPIQPGHGRPHRKQDTTMVSGENIITNRDGSLQKRIAEERRKAQRELAERMIAESNNALVFLPDTDGRVTLRSSRLRLTDYLHSYMPAEDTAQ